MIAITQLVCFDEEILPYICINRERGEGDIDKETDRQTYKHKDSVRHRDREKEVHSSNLISPPYSRIVGKANISHTCYRYTNKEIMNLHQRKPVWLDLGKGREDA